MTYCKGCITPCEMHGLAGCAMCHKHADQCEMGSCTEKSTQLWEFTAYGRIYERRRFCPKHSKSPFYAWLRKDGKHVTGPLKAKAIQV